MALKKIMIAAPVYQHTGIFIEYLNSLNHLVIPDDYEIHKYFILTNSPELEQFLSPNEYEIDNQDFKTKKEKGSHFWDTEHFNSVMQARNKILKKAREDNYDYLFSVDSDILLHPKTLKYLLDDNKDMVGMAYWCKNSSTNKIGNNYYYTDNWGIWPNINDNLINKGLYEVGIACACILIGKRILDEKRITYTPIDNVKFTEWEDYALSLRAHILIPDIQVYMDSRLPCRELTNLNCYKRWMAEKALYE